MRSPSTKSTDGYTDAGDTMASMPRTASEILRKSASDEVGTLATTTRRSCSRCCQLTPSPYPNA